MKPNNQLNCNTNMNKKLIRLTESDLHRIVKQSVNRVLKESSYDYMNTLVSIKNSRDVCKLFKYRVLEQKIDGDDLN